MLWSIFFGIIFVYIIIKLSDIEPEQEKTQYTYVKPKTKIADTGSPYKKSGLKHFEIRGLRHQNLLRRQDEGTFIGSLRPENNPHDRYAVGIYREPDNRLIGHVPKGNFRLYNSINLNHSGSLLCWGYIIYIEDEWRHWNGWNGSVNFYVGVNENQQKKIIELLQLDKKIDLLAKRSNPVKSMKEAYKLLLKRESDFDDVTQLIKKDHGISQMFFVTLYKNMAEEKMWDEIMKFAELDPDIVNRVPQNYRSSLEKRITKAKSKSAL